MTDAAKPNASICPLCGTDNRCTMASTGDSKNCWCTNQAFPEGVLQSSQAVANRERCVCQACIEKTRLAIDAG